MKDKFYIVYIEDTKYHKRFWDKRFCWVFDNEDDADDFQSSLSIFLSGRYAACLIDGTYVYRKHGANDKEVCCFDCQHYHSENKFCLLVDMNVCFPDVGCSHFEKIES